MTGRLGDPAYRILIVDNKVGGIVAELSSFVERGQWNRRLDDVTEGQVTVIATSDCCHHLEKIAITRHDLAIFRDEDLVWQGPIVQIRTSGEKVRIIARDAVWWMTRRAVHNSYDFSESPIVATTYIDTIIKDAMEPDDRGVLENVIIQGGEQTTSRTITANTKSAYAELRDLSDILIDYTTLGKSIIVAEDLFNFGIVARLTDDHFRDEVEIIDDGINFSTKGIFRGQNIIQVFDNSSGYYGLVEGFIRDGRTLDDETARQAARNAVGDAMPARLIAGQGGAFLSADAPVTANGLVAGALLQVSLSRVCRPVTQVQRIESVEVNWDNAIGIGEQFGLRLGPIDTTRAANFDRS